MYKENYVVDREPAQAEFERFADAMDLDLDEEGLDENERQDQTANIAKVIKGIFAGALSQLIVRALRE
jgi:hypothetical protein